jgi:hypothetical protein
MATQTENLKVVHFEHKELLVRVDFFKSELDIFEKMLEEVCIDNNLTDIRIAIEHFQNQFLLHRHRLMNIKHDVNKSESAIARKLMDNMSVVNKVEIVKSEGDLRSAINTFDYLFTELKREFKLFLKKVYLTKQ